MKEKNTWFRAYKFTNSKINFDWSWGISEWSKVKDCITDEWIPKFSTIFWNRSLGNICVSLDTYNSIVKGSDENLKKKLLDIELPLDIRV